MGMIGGGPGAFIGSVHRTAAAMDGLSELIAGAFSSDPLKSEEKGEELNLSKSRVYGSFKEMIEKESRLPQDERLDFVSIVTPNHLHFEPAKLALEKGFHVVVDKPMTFDLKEAFELKAVAERSGKYFCITHTYTGYPMIKEARQQIADGRLGKIRKILVNYPQGWLSSFLEGSHQKQAAWRTDPSRSGIAGAMGDIGSHAFNLAEYVSGLKVTKLCADINVVVEGRQLDDDGAMLLKFENGASGILVASQVMSGEENNLQIDVYGEKAGLSWKHSEANTLVIRNSDRPVELLRAGTGYLSSFAKHNTRTPAGHPEGYLEAFANLYRNFILCIQAQLNNQQPEPEWLDFPNAEDGLRGMMFIQRAIESGRSDEKWLTM